MFISLLFNHRYNFRYLICFYTSTWSHWILVCLFRYFWVSKHRAKHTGQKHSCPCCPYHKAERGWLQDKHKWFTAGVWGKHERRAEKGRWQGWGCVVVIVGGLQPWRLMEEEVNRCPQAGRPGPKWSSHWETGGYPENTGGLQLEGECRMQNRNSVVSRNKSAIKQQHKLDSDLTVTGFLFHLEEMQYSPTPHDSIWCNTLQQSNYWDDLESKFSPIWWQPMTLIKQKHPSYLIDPICPLSTFIVDWCLAVMQQWWQCISQFSTFN